MSKKMMIFYSFPFNFLWKSLMTLMTMTLMTGFLSFLYPMQLVISHAARYSERSSDSGQYADGYLQNCFPSVRFHLF